MRTSGPRLCTWMRAPSSFHSNATSPPANSRSASPTSAAVWASIGATGANSSSWKRRRPGLPCVRALCDTAPRLPAYIAARRTSATGSPAAAAMASTMTPSSAPWRSSPASSCRRNCCSSGVASAKSAPRAAARRGADPTPRSCASAVSRTSRSVIDSDGLRGRASARGGGAGARSPHRCAPGACRRPGSGSRGRFPRVRASAAARRVRAPWPGGCGWRARAARWRPVRPEASRRHCSGARQAAPLSAW